MTSTSIGTPVDRLAFVNGILYAYTIRIIKYIYLNYFFSEVMLNLYGSSCLYTEYYGYTEYFRISTNWDDFANSGGGIT